MEAKSLAVVAPHKTSELIRSIDDLLRISETLLKSGLLPAHVKTREAATAIILQGREVGFGAMASFALIQVIQGKPTISPQGMLALINGCPQLENFDAKPTADGKGYRVTMKRRGLAEHVETFTLDDAAKMGLIEKDNYKKQPLTMLKWRAISACARVVFPDVIAGMYLPEEMGAAVNEDGEIIEGTAVPSEPPKTEPAAANPTPAEPTYDRTARLEHLKSLRTEIKDLGGNPSPLYPSGIDTQEKLEEEIGVTESQLSHLKAYKAATAPASA